MFELEITREDAKGSETWTATAKTADEAITLRNNLKTAERRSPGNTLDVKISKK